MVFSKSQKDLEERYQSFVKCDQADSYGKRYPNLVKHLEVFWERSSEWALSFRIEMIFWNNHTNNYAEAAIRVLKEMIFGRMEGVQFDTDVHRHHGEVLQKRIIGYGSLPLSTRYKLTFQGCLQTHQHHCSH
jgi:hypothetical protein